MPQIEFDIHGSGANEALADLILAKELTMQVTPPAAGQTKGFDIQTVGTLIGIIGGAAGAAELLIKWYQAWRKGKGRLSLDHVMIITAAGNRVFLEDLSAEKLAELLNTVEDG